MAKPYRWGDVAPPAVAALKQRRQHRAEAAEFFRLTGGRLLAAAPAVVAVAVSGWLRSSAQEPGAVDPNLQLSGRDELEPQLFELPLAGLHR